MTATTNTGVMSEFVMLLAHLESEPFDSDDDQPQHGNARMNSLDNTDTMMMKPGTEENVVPWMFEIFDHFYDRVETFSTSRDFVGITKIICNVARNCEKYDKDYIYQTFLPRFSTLFNHRREFVRKYAAETINNLAKCFGTTFTEKCLVPHLINLSEDDDPSVRDACVSQFADIAGCCSSEVHRNLLTTSFVEFINKESFNNPKCAKELGRFISTFADSKKTGLVMRDGKIINLNRKRHKNRRNKRPGSRKFHTSTSSHQSNGHLSDAPPPDPENKLSIGFLQIQSPTSNRSTSDNESSIKGSLKSISSSSSSSDVSSNESDEDFLSVEDIPNTCGLINNNQYVEPPQGFESPTKPSYAPPTKTHYSALNNGSKESDFWGEMNPDDMDEFDGSDDEDAMNSSFMHDEIEVELEDPPQSSKLPDLPKLEFKDETVEESCSSFSYWASSVEIDKLDIENYNRTSRVNVQEIKQETEKSPSQNGGFLSGRQYDSNLAANIKEKSLFEYGLSAPFADISELDEDQPLMKTEIDDEIKQEIKTEETEVELPGSQQESLKLFLNNDSETTTNFFSTDTTTDKILFSNGTSLDVVKTSSSTIISPSKSGDSFWPKGFIQKTTESMKKTTAAALQSAEEISHASSALFSKVRLAPFSSRFLAPSPRKLYQSRSPPIPRESRTPEPPSIIGSEGVKRFLTEEEREQFYREPQDVIPQELLDTVLQLQSTDYKQNDTQRHRTLAESFPAIVYTFGPENWIYIKPMYMSFCVHENQNVRVKMAQSLHQIAQILGPHVAERDLCPLFQKFARDNTEVQQALLKNLYAFIKAMPIGSRQSLAAELNAFNTYEVNSLWRLRHEFIEQLTKLVGLFKPYEINEYLVPFALAFSADKISEIRVSAIYMVASILSVFIEHEHLACKRSGLSIASPNSMPLSEKFLEEIKNGFWKTKNWRRRQSFAMMMKIMLDEEMISRKKFCYIFKPQLIELMAEEIPNIRQYFCKLIELIGQDRLENIDPELHSLVRSRLHHMAADDSDLEIRMMARVVLGTVDKIRNEVDLTCRVVQSETSTSC